MESPEFLRELGIRVEVSEKDSIIAFHDNAHGDHESPEEGYAVSFDGMPYGLMMFDIIGLLRLLIQSGGIVGCRVDLWQLSCSLNHVWLSSHRGQNKRGVERQAESYSQIVSSIDLKGGLLPRK